MIEVNYLMNYTYAEPAQLKVVVMADQASSWFPKDIGSMKRISPDESHHAFVMATARDLAQTNLRLSGKMHGVQVSPHSSDWSVMKTPFGVLEKSESS